MHNGPKMGHTSGPPSIDESNEYTTGAGVCCKPPRSRPINRHQRVVPEHPTKHHNQLYTKPKVLLDPALEILIH